MQYIQKILFVFCLQLTICIGQVNNLIINQNPFYKDSLPKHIIGVPFSNSNLTFYTNLNQIISLKNKTLNIDLSGNLSNSLNLKTDLNNELFFYAQKKDNKLYYIGIHHRLWLNINMNQDFISLIMSGNNQFLNDNVVFSDNYIDMYNYLSLNIGYNTSSRLFNLIGFELKLIKGLYNIHNSPDDNINLSTSDYFNSHNTPFTSLLFNDINIFINHSFDFFSDLGGALDMNIEYAVSNKSILYGSIEDLGFISWNQDQYSSNGNYELVGVIYNLDQDIVTEYNALFDTLIDVFDVDRKRNRHSVKALPYKLNIGLNSFVNAKDHFTFNYQKQTSPYRIFHTASFMFSKQISKYQISITPIISIVNKYYYSRFTIVLNKIWANKLMTNLAFQKGINNRQLGFGVSGSVYFLF